MYWLHWEPRPLVSCVFLCNCFCTWLECKLSCLWTLVKRKQPLGNPFGIFFSWLHFSNKVDASGDLPHFPRKLWWAFNIWQRQNEVSDIEASISLSLSRSLSLIRMLVLDYYVPGWWNDNSLWLLNAGTNWFVHTWFLSWCPQSQMTAVKVTLRYKTSFLYEQLSFPSPISVKMWAPPT